MNPAHPHSQTAHARLAAAFGPAPFHLAEDDPLLDDFARAAHEQRLNEGDVATFADAVRSSDEMREHVQAVERMIFLPRGGQVTPMTGRLDGDASLITQFVLPDGRSFTSTQVVSQGDFVVRQTVPALEASETLELKEDSCRFRLGLDSDRRIVEVHGAGWHPSLRGVVQKALEDRPLVDTGTA